MNCFRSATVIALGVVALCAVSCASNRQYRTNLSSCDSTRPGADCTNAVIETAPDYKLGFVEFDDQGWFWDTNQMLAVEQMIRTEAGIGQTNLSDAEGIVIVLFVHGWKNNAAYDNDNVSMFRSILQLLRQGEGIEGDSEKSLPRKVVGVYAGWRGLSAELEPFKELSFWERKNTAHKVGAYGAMTELLIRLESLQTASNRALKTNTARTELIIMGHSFGGAAVYSAAAQIVTERFAQTVGHGRALRPLGDQIILLNPAFEAARHYNLNEMAVSVDKYPPSQRPVLSIFTSKGDWATHYVFPAGRFFSTIFEKHRDKMQGNANREAVGWFKPFITHDLVYDTNAVAATAGLRTYKKQVMQEELHDPNRLQKSEQNLRAQRGRWPLDTTAPATYSFDDCVLNPRAAYKPGNPVLVVSVDKRIMSGHDDLTNPVMVNFLREFIEFSRTNPRARAE